MRARHVLGIGAMPRRHSAFMAADPPAAMEHLDVRAVMRTSTSARMNVCGTE